MTSQVSRKAAVFSLLKAIDILIAGRIRWEVTWLLFLFLFGESWRPIVCIGTMHVLFQQDCFRMFPCGFS